MFIERKIRCWKCGKMTDVYSWHDHVLWDKNCPEEGRPGTLKFVKSSVVHGGYWANHCSECGIIQGDWFLYCEGGIFRQVRSR